MGFSWLSSVQTFGRKVQKSLVRRGVLSTAKRFLTKPLEFARSCIKDLSSAHRQCRAAELEFDQQMHVETSVDNDPGWMARIKSANWIYGIGYAPIPLGHGRSILAGLGIHYEDYVFIDYGAGKGRMLFLASELPFAKVIGVEYSPDLFASLERNLKTYVNPSQRCSNLDAELQDAVYFDLPNEPLVLFFHHPFDEIVFRQVLNRIEQSLDQSPRPIHVIYYDPVCGSLFEKSKYFQLRQRGERDRRVRYGSSWNVYASSPEYSGQPVGHS